MSDLFYRLADYYNQAQKDFMKDLTGNTLASLNHRYDKDDKIEIAKRFYYICKDNGISIQVNPEGMTGQLSVDPLPRGKLLE